MMNEKAVAAASPMHGTAVVIPGPVANIEGRHAHGVAWSCPAALGASETGGLSCVLVVASAVGGGETVASTLGARFAAEQAEKHLRGAVDAWRAAGSGPGTAGALLEQARRATVAAWAETAHRHHARTRRAPASAVRDVEPNLEPYDAVVAAAAVVGNTVLALGVGSAQLAIFGQRGLTTSRSEDRPRESLARAARNEAGETPGWSAELCPHAEGLLQILLLTSASRDDPRTLAVAIPGAGHARSGGKPCQDAVVATRRDGVVLLSVADGHGDERYTHSDLGSRFAIDSVREVFETNAEAIRAEVAATPVRENRGTKLARRLAAAVLAGWYARIRDYLDMGDARTTAPPGDGFDPRVATFGTTFLTAIAWRDGVLCLRVGDGDILIVDQHGPRRVFPLPEKQFGNATASLASAPRSERSVHDLAEVAVVPARPKLVLVCSDGVSDPYFPAEVDAERDGRASALAERWGSVALENVIRQGFDGWAKCLPPILGQLSSASTFDDVSVAVAWWPEPAVAPALADWAAQQVTPLDGDWGAWAQDLPRRVAEWASSFESLRELSLAVAAVKAAPEQTTSQEG